MISSAGLNYTSSAFIEERGISERTFFHVVRIDDSGR
jgi:hypothetical protein